jgi:hypothetical protein
MTKRKPELENLIKRYGGQVTKADKGRVNVIYPEAWLAQPKTRKKTR